MQSMNSDFFYAVDVSEDDRLKNFLWVDGKSRHDYAHFSDVVSLTLQSVKNVVKQNEEEFMVKFEKCIYRPWTDEELEERGQNLVDMFELNENKLFLSLECLALGGKYFTGILHSDAKYEFRLLLCCRQTKYKIPHYEFVLLGTALLSNESSATLSWVMRTWLRAMGESVKNVVKQNEEEFMVKFEKCIYRPWTDEELEERGHNLVDMFELNENKLFLSLECLALGGKYFTGILHSDAKYEFRLLLCCRQTKYKIPHYEFVLLGTALLSNESSATLSWVMRTWLRAMGESVKNVVKQNEEEFMMQSMNSDFFYAVDVSEDDRLKNFLWVDAKSRHDYAHFSDVVSFDATSATLSWVMRTWLRAMGESVKNVVKQNEEEFMVKFEKCIYRPWTDEELEERGQNLVDMFELNENKLFLSLEFVADSVSKRQPRELSVVEDPMQSMNSNFFYAVDVSEDHRLKNFLWVDAKSRHDYADFSDVVSFDATFATLSWVMRTWQRAMGGEAPKAIVTDHE
nr:protein FAR-RED ELONGATED HYPOCOTYL 3-like [Ipomoea trifida]